MAAAGRAVISAEEASGLNQALVSQCLLVVLRDSVQKNQEEEQEKNLAEELKAGRKNLK